METLTPLTSLHSKLDGNKKSETSDSSVKSVRNGVLLLQGPAGPFFRKAQRFLIDHGIDAWRVCFHAGDYLNTCRDKTIAFRGGSDDWMDWLNGVLSSGAFDTIILFGSERPAHVEARKLADQYGVRVISLEEGYVRPGYITAEVGGNNASSPLAGKLPPVQGKEIDDLPPTQAFNTMRFMMMHSLLYYTVRGVMTHGKPKELFHRAVPLFREAVLWMRNFSRRMFGGSQDFKTIQHLLEHVDHKYFLVPLQVAADANLVKFGSGWSSVRLITESLISFAKSAPPQTRLVFKIHPMERGHNNLTGLIKKTAETLGVEGRVDVIETGSLGLLTRHSAGMITINSTSGLSAIYHGVPLMVLGEAIYAHPALTHCCKGTSDFDCFWTSKHVADPALRRRYLAWLKQSALQPGDFYCPEGIEVACKSILKKLGEPKTVGDTVVKLKVAS